MGKPGINERFNKLLLLKKNIVSIQSILFLTCYAAQTQNIEMIFLFIKYTIKVVRKMGSTDYTI